jgi:hypothetical protein
MNHFIVVVDVWLTSKTLSPGLDHPCFPLMYFGSIFSILNLLLWTEVPLESYYNTLRAETLK